MSPKRINIIGAGAAGLAAAISSARKGHDVAMFDKNDQVGGRIRTWQKEGFTFDMGPSWYWMPEVFDALFKEAGKQREDYYDLEKLDPAYRVFFSEDDILDVPAQWETLVQLFENKELGAGKRLESFMNEAKYKYEVGMNEFVWKVGRSIWEFADWRVIKAATRLDMFTSISKHVRKHFKHPHLIKIMEFPVLFLGADPKKTPALYSLMNYADLKLNTWYPKGGMGKISESLAQVATELGVKIHLDSPVKGIEVRDNYVQSIRMLDETISGNDGLISAADYEHTEHLLPKNYRQYSEKYWNQRKMSPSSLLFYIGVDKKIPRLLHHNLFFDESFEKHSSEIYDKPSWPQKPLFYVCCPSKTDSEVAPEGCENLFILIPLAAGLYDREENRETLFKYLCNKLHKYVGVDIRDHLKVKRSFAMSDFASLYNSFKGNAYGLANTLDQTAFLKPSMYHKKLKNMMYAGQLTVPGPGLPPSIISGRMAAREMDGFFRKNKT